ncbi:MAG: S8 family serine peptidase [Pseudomonadota bacterium]|nr:S8 family serine peptidase [Pseudomonadota bacterium]
MILFRAVLFLMALTMPVGFLLAAQEPAARGVKEPASEEAARPDAVEQAERKKILVMIEQAPNRLRPGSSYSSGYGSAQTKAARERLGRSIAKQYGFRFVELWPMPLIGLDCFILEFDQKHTAAQAARMIEKHPSVEWAEPMAVYEGLSSKAARSDPLNSLSPAFNDWNLSRVHSLWTGRNVSVAVIDTQVDVNHPELRGRVKLARNFAPQAPSRPEYHGTEVAGIIAANARNGLGIAGVAPEARIMALRACWQRGNTRASTCTSLNLARALNYAIERDAKIINLSLGGPPNRLLARLIETASQRGIAVVAAFDPAKPNGGFPASHPNVIAVSQIGQKAGQRTSRGYAAPGKDVPTIQPGGGFYFVTGSSYSAAHVSGLLALKYERARKRRGIRTSGWRALEQTDSRSRKIDIAATFD